MTVQSDTDLEIRYIILEAAQVAEAIERAKRGLPYIS